MSWFADQTNSIFCWYRNDKLKQRITTTQKHKQTCKRQTCTIHDVRACFQPLPLCSWYRWWYTTMSAFKACPKSSGSRMAINILHVCFNYNNYKYTKNKLSRTSHVIIIVSFWWLCRAGETVLATYYTVVNVVCVLLTIYWTKRHPEEVQVLACLKYIAVIWSLFKYRAVIWLLFKYRAVIWSLFKYRAVIWSLLKCRAVIWSLLKCMAVIWSLLKCRAVIWSLLKCYKGQLFGHC